MKRSWLSQLFITLSVGLLVISSADAATMVPITVCADCHGTNPQTNQSPVESSIRNDPANLRSIIGSHSYHVTTQALTCAGCHVVPTTLDHRDGNINMAATMSGGVTYSAATGGIVPQDNQLNTTGLGTCTGTSCHSSGKSPTWGTASTCQTCHGYPPVTTLADPDAKHVAGATAVNHIGTLANANTKATFVSVHGGCQICHGTESTTDGTGNIHNPAPGYVVLSQHGTGNINMNGPIGTGTGYDPSIRGCTAACHGSAAPYRMTASGKTLTLANYGISGECITCHLTSQPSPKAALLNAAVASRVAVVPSFSLASKHTRSRGTSVTNSDCCVCHMEGETATGSKNATYHGNGYIELRNPDTGLTIKGVTHSGTTSTGGVYTSTATDARPVRFTRNLNTATIEPDTAAIMVNQCLKCHDANGALSATAIVSGGTALKPFGGTVAANPGGGVLDVASQFASSNKSFHPVLVRQNNGYIASAKLVAPWNITMTKVAAGTAVYGPLITCWDCHAPNGTVAATTLTTSGVHGAAVTGSDVVPLRGTVYTSGTTAAANLCLYCHVVSAGTSNHGTGSAITSGTDGGMTYFQNRCYFCHSSVDTNAHAARPRGAGDAHGYNTNADGTTIATAGRGYAFIRRLSLPVIVKTVGGTNYTPTCGTATGICSRSMGGYTPGGVY